MVIERRLVWPCSFSGCAEETAESHTPGRLPGRDFAGHEFLCHVTFSRGLTPRRQRGLLESRVGKCRRQVDFELLLGRKSLQKSKLESKSTRNLLKKKESIT